MIFVSILKQRLKEIKRRVRLRSYVVVGIHLRFMSAGSSSNSLCTAPVVFSLFVFFKQKTNFFQTETKLFQMKRGVPALWGALRGVPWRLQPPTEHGLNKPALFQGASHWFARFKGIWCL